jgi:hypothetical protein
MKTLFLIRHAKSSWDNTALPDKDRPLGDRGRRDAPKMGKRLGGPNRGGQLGGTRDFHSSLWDYCNDQFFFCRSHNAERFFLFFCRMRTTCRGAA